jgi:NAD(P)-dependent dehydrogenase (short-subunit alcohol dehydrogenase family)
MNLGLRDKVVAMTGTADNISRAIALDFAAEGALPPAHAVIGLVTPHLGRQTT